MKKFVDIYAIAQRLLTPNETLDLRLFDFSGKMHYPVREQLLQNANYVAQVTIGRIPGIMVDDILLNGSAASYFYYDKSDIDVRIQAINKDCSYIATQPKDFNNFLLIMQNGCIGKFNFNLDERFVDIKLKSTDSEPMGLYSIIHDKWIIEPNQRATEGLELDDIMTEFKKRYYNIKSHMQQLQDSGALKTKEGIDQLIKIYHDIFLTNTSSTREYIVYKLLNYRGVLIDIKKLIASAQFDYLSLK